MTEIDFYFFLRTGWLLGPFALMEQMATTTAARRAPIIRCVCVPLHHFTFFLPFHFFSSFKSQPVVCQWRTSPSPFFIFPRTQHTRSLYLYSGRPAGERATHSSFNIFIMYGVYPRPLWHWPRSLSLSGVASDRTESSRYSHLLLEGNKDDGNKRKGTKGGERGRE